MVCTLGEILRGTTASNGKPNCNLRQRKPPPEQHDVEHVAQRCKPVPKVTPLRRGLLHRLIKISLQLAWRSVLSQRHPLLHAKKEVVFGLGGFHVRLWGSAHLETRVCVSVMSVTCFSL